jgi:hydroxymethylglutaryl-CoA lyase
MKLIECPRDAMQGLETFIPTEKKHQYIQSLLEVGFDTIDFGSFVSPKAIPQMADTSDLLDLIDLTNTNTKLLAIVANMRGVEAAAKSDKVHYLGYPFSISETFQLRNTKKSILESLEFLEEASKNYNAERFVVYISMGFGNPYNDEWSLEIIKKYISKISKLGIKTISIADTVGSATVATIKTVFTLISKEFSNLELGLHLHSHPSETIDKVKAAYTSGVKRLDSAIYGFGGCPFAKNDLVGNLATETVVDVLSMLNVEHHINKLKLDASMKIASEIFHK